MADTTPTTPPGPAEFTPAAARARINVPDGGMASQASSNPASIIAAAGPAARLVNLILGEPNPLREIDLLSLDQPLKPYPPLHRWRFNAGLRALFFIAVFAAASLLSGLGLSAALSGIGWAPEQISNFFAGYSTVLGIATALLAYWLLGRVLEGRRPIHELALRRAAHGALAGLAIGAVLMLVCAGLLGLAGVYQVQGVNAGYSPWKAILVVGFGAGIIEEILFRGIAFRLLEDTFGTWAAIGVSGLCFGLIHLSNPHATWQGAIGIALEAGLLFAALYAFTRSLWLVMGLHFAWNVVQGPLLGIVVSGSSAQGAGLLKSTMVGPEWISGGSFGIEASLLTIVLLTAVGLQTMVLLARRGLVVQPFWVRRRVLREASRARS